MADPRIIDIQLDERTILRRSDNVEQERRIAILDLIAKNHFQPRRDYPEDYAGPYRVRLSVEEGRLAIGIASAEGDTLESLILGLAKFRRPVRDYFAICDSYYQALHQSTPGQIETIDMARRAIHNEAAELLIERLDGKIDLDFDTARRLFTLICVLHFKG